ncbi:MAG: hypothetical protein PVF58_08515 [Candidatus Methanofastidiosia archaeon]|jgi:hypothetical protein
MDNDVPTKKSKKEIVVYLSIILLLTFSFNLIAGHMSHLVLTSLRFFGFILFLAVFLALFPYSILPQVKISHIREDAAMQNKVVTVFLMVIAFIILFAASNKVYWMLSFGILMFGLSIISTLKIEKYILPITVGTFLHIVVYIVYMYNAAVYKGITWVSEGFTRIIGRIIATPLELGPSASGFWIWLYFALCILGIYFTATNKNNSIKRVILSLCGSVILWVLSIVLYGIVFLHLGIYDLSEITLLQIALFFMLAGIFFVTVHNVIVQLPKITVTKNWKQSGVFLFLFVSAVLLVISPYIVNTKEQGKIVFYQRECAMGSYIPEFPEEGESLTGDRGISFGTMLWFFKERGYTIEILDNENTVSVKESLKDADVFITANLNEPLSSEDIESIKSFVYAGGGLLIFGEHTNMMADPVDFQSGYHYLNDILEGTGITIKTDTAEWTQNHWQTSVMVFPHPAVKGINPADVHTGSVGASLSITRAAQPVMVGRYAFSDNPNPLEPGFLGDRKYDPGELLGDIVLAASSTYGKGKVLVFGDTSYGFNEALPGTWVLMENCIEFLTGTGNSSLEWGGLILFLVAVGVLFSTKNIFTKASAGYALLIISFLVSSFILSTMGVTHEKTDTIAWIDTGHCNLLNTHGYKDNSVDGLCKNFMRNQYIPLYIQSMSQLDQGSILTIIAPTRTYSRGEVKKITSFVENGGLLILSVGAMEKNAVNPLLHAFEMDIGNIPLGPVPWIIETHGRTPQISDEDLEKYWHEPKFMEVYPVAGSGSVTSYASLTYLGQTFNLIIAKQYGKGMVVLIGDSRFLLNENLEYSLDPARLGKPTFAALWVGNIELLKDIITDYQEGLHE